MPEADPSSSERRRRVVSWISGWATVVALWIVILPWDLSEVTADDALRNDGLQNAWPLVVLLVCISAVLGGVVTYRSTLLGESFLWGAGCTFLILFAWRTSVAHTRGANFWLVGLIFYALPGMAAGFAAAYWTGRALGGTRQPEVEHKD